VRLFPPGRILHINNPEMAGREELRGLKPTDINKVRMVVVVAVVVVLLLLLLLVVVLVVLMLMLLLLTLHRHTTKIIMNPGVNLDHHMPHAYRSGKISMTPLDVTATCHAHSAPQSDHDHVPISDRRNV